MFEESEYQIKLLWLALPTAIHILLNFRNTWYERDTGTAQVSILSTLFFALSVLEPDGRQHTWLPACMLAFGSIFALASLHERHLKVRVGLAWGSLCAIITAVTILNGAERANLFFCAFSATLSLFIMTQYLIGFLEREIETKLVIGNVWGLAQHFPRVSGLLLACLILLGCGPGSILFITEDLILHFASGYSVFAVICILIISFSSGVALYQGYLDLFTGQDLQLEQRFSVRREEPALPLVVGTLLFTLVLGLCPRFFY